MRRWQYIVPVSFTLLLSIIPAYAQDEDSTAVDSVEVSPWQVQTEVDFGIAQSTASENWTGGEASSVSWLSEFRAYVERRQSSRWLWNQELRLAFGQVHRHDETVEAWVPPEKSSDRIRYDAIWHYLSQSFLVPYAAGYLESQFVDQTGRKARFLYPMELSETFGVSHDLVNRPDQLTVSIQLGVGFRQRYRSEPDCWDPTIIRDVSGTDGGFEWVTGAQVGSFTERFYYVTRLTLFKALFDTRADKFDDRWQAVDIAWDNSVRVVATRIVLMSLDWQLLYDKQLDKGGRFMQELSLNLSYRYSH